MPLSSALRSRAYRAALAAAFVGDFSLVGSRSAVVPQFVVDRLHLSTGWVYAAFLTVSLTSGALLLPLGHAADRRGRRPVIAVGLVLGAFGFVVLTAAPASGGLLLGMALLGVAGAADSVAPGAVMGDVLGGRGGSVVAVFQMAGDLGAVLGPVAGGFLVSVSGYPAALLASAAVTLTPLVLVRIAPETLVINVSASGVSSTRK
jgi:MFS family permease